MKKKSTILSITGIFLALLLTGCGDGEKKYDSPSARNQLVIRLFNSMKEGNYASAAEQARKLSVLDEGNAYLGVIATRQKTNMSIVRAQKLLDKGDFAAAVSILEEALRQNPLDRELEVQLIQARFLDRFGRDLKRLEAASSAGDRAVIISAMEKNAAKYRLPELTKQLELMKRDINAELEREKQLREQQTAQSDIIKELPAATAPAAK